MEANKGIRVYGIALVVFGLYNLIGVGSYGQFSMMFKPLAAPFIVAIYLFTILYGICAVYCGTRILRLENWARKVMIAMTSVSVVSGLLLNRTVMANFKEFIMTEQSRVPPEIAGSVYNYAIIMTAAITLFELSVIFFFTRPRIASQFK
jgi:hypothetical protein